jgi:perosamine synthetase
VAHGHYIPEGFKGEWNSPLIPYGRHYVTCIDALRVAWQIRFHSLTQGSKILDFERSVANLVGAKFAVATSSATAALHIAVQSLDLPENSKIVTSPISFVASSNSILYSGHVPIFADINKETLNIDAHQISRILTKHENIRALIPVHFAGLPSGMSEIAKLSRASGLQVIEDAAHSLGAKYETGEMVGSCKYSDMTVFSFHPVKSITTGEGGMITTNEYDTYKKLLRLRSHGIDKLDDLFENQIHSHTSGLKNPWYYEMVELGYNYRITDIQATLGLSQLKKLPKFISKREKLARNYDKLFEKSELIKPAQTNYTSKSSNHIYPVRINYSRVGISRAELMLKLLESGIGSQVHYIPIPMHPYYQKLGYEIERFPESMAFYNEALSIPLFPNLSGRSQRFVARTLKKILEDSQLK